MKFFQIIFLAICVIFVTSAENFVRRDVIFENNMTKNEAEVRLRNSPVRNSRLAGGNTAENTDFPYVVDIATFWFNGEVRGCTGSIIASFIIMTSRDCLFDDSLRRSPDNTFVQVGAASRSTPRFGTFVSGATWVDIQGQPQGPHPNFAIANLTDFLTMGPNVNVVRLLSFPQSTMSFENQPVDIAGWGPTTGNNLHWARKTVSPIVPGTIVGLSQYEFALWVSPATFENGDNGGPMVIREAGGDTLIGVLWTSRFSVTQNANIFTAMQIGQFWDFIHEVTGIPRRWS